MDYLKAYTEIDPELVERLLDTNYLKWMIKNLEQYQLGILIAACEQKVPSKKIASLPVKFLQNRLLKIKKDFLWVKMIPPYGDLIELRNEQEEFTEEEIFEIADNHPYEYEPNDIALMLFLQNHFEASLKYYEQHHQSKNGTREVSAKLNQKEHTERPKVSEEKDEKALSPKIEKKLQDRIQTLTNEKKQYMQQLKEVREELKEKNRATTIEMNELNRQLIAEKNERQLMKEKYEQLVKELADEKTEKSHLAAKILHLEEVQKKSRKKIALIGNPMNQTLLNSIKYDIDLFDVDNMKDLIELWTNYEERYFLAYAFDEMVFEALLPSSIREKIKIVETFTQLKREMEER